MDKNGLLNIDDNKLNDALENKFDEVVTLFGANASVTDTNKGISGDAIEKLDEMLTSTGIVNEQSTNAEMTKRR